MSTYRVNFYEKNTKFPKFAEAQGVTATLDAGMNERFSVQSRNSQMHRWRALSSSLLVAPRWVFDWVGGIKLLDWDEQRE